MRLLLRRLGARAEDETACILARKTFLGVEFEQRVSGRSAAGEEVEDDVAGAGCLLQQVLDQRQRLRVVERAVAEDVGDDASAFLVGPGDETAFGFILAGFEGRHHPARQGLRLVAQVGLVALELRPAEADRAADPEFQIGQVATKQRRLAAFRNVAGIDRGEQRLQRRPYFNAWVCRKDDLAEFDEFLYRLRLEGLPFLEATFGRKAPDAVGVGRVGDSGLRVEQRVVEVGPVLVRKSKRYIAEPPVATWIPIRVAVHLVGLGEALEGKTGVAVDEDVFVVDREEALLVGVRPLPGTPGDAAEPPARHHLVHQQLQSRTVLVVDRDHDHAVGGEQVAREAKSAVEEFEPLRMPPAVIGADVAVVIDPVLVAGVVRRVDVDHANPAGVRRLEEAQRVEVVALDDQVAPAGELGRCFAWVRVFGKQPRQDEVGVDRSVALDRVRLPGEAEFLPGQVLYQQAAQLGFVEVFQFGEQAVLWHGHGAIFCPVFRLIRADNADSPGEVADSSRDFTSTPVFFQTARSGACSPRARPP